MPLETHSGLPSQITAGDTIQWSEAQPDDESEVISAIYHFAPDAGGDGFEIEKGAQSGTDYVYLIKEADTAKIKPGNYTGDLVVHRDPSGRKSYPGKVSCRILPNPAAKRELTHEERMIPILERFMESDERMLERHSVAGVETVRMDRNAAELLLRKYKGIVRNQEAGRRAAEGKKTGQTVLIHF